jgi:hypothetical protein
MKHHHSAELVVPLRNLRGTTKNDNPLACSTEYDCL